MVALFIFGTYQWDSVNGSVQDSRIVNASQIQYLHTTNLFILKCPLALNLIVPRC